MSNYCPYFNCPYYDAYNDFRQQPTYPIVAEQTVQSYVGKMISTSVPGYGRINAFVLDYNPNTRMARLLRIYPNGAQEYMQVSSQDMVGIEPYFGFPQPPSSPFYGGYPGGGYPGGGGYMPPPPGGGGYMPGPGGGSFGIMSGGGSGL